MAITKAGYKKIRIALAIAFAALMLLIIYAGATVPEIKSFPAYTSRGPITIRGDSEFTAGNGVTGGSGTESDPYLIEGWEISAESSNGLSISDSSAHVVIKNIVVRGTYSSFYPREAFDGIVLQNASNVVVDRAYISSAFNGVLVQETRPLEPNSVWIKHCTITGCRSNIYLINSSNCDVDYNTIRRASSSNIVIDYCSSLALDHNYVTRYDVSHPDDDSLSVGISILDSTNITVHGNEMDGSYYEDAHISVARCQDVVIEENEIGALQTDKVEISDSSEILFQHNMCSGDGPISLTESVGCTLQFNEISTGSIHIYSSSNVAVYRNHLVSAGIFTQLTTDSAILENIVSGNAYYYGMKIDGSNIRIAGNLLTYNEWGMYVGGRDITADGNIILSNTEGASYPYQGGLWSHSVTNLTATNNSIIVYPRSDTAIHAIWFQSGANITISNCNVSGDIWCGRVTDFRISDSRIDGDSRLTFSSESTGLLEILHNSMHNITVDDSAVATMIWDAGYPGGGNYWSQYSGIDEKSGASQNQPGSDGIGDTPYVITPTATDPYPLMTPIVQNDTTPPITRLTLMSKSRDRGWFSSEVNFTLSAEDNIMGVKAIHYRLDNGPWNNYSAKANLSGDGEHTLEYYSEDWAGNLEHYIRTTVIRIDTESPQLVEGQPLVYRFKNTDIATIHFEFQDNVSGVQDYEFTYHTQGYSLESFNTIPIEELELHDGTRSYRLLAQDEAGNVNSTTIELMVSLNENREPMSVNGPYGPWFNFGLLADFSLLLLALGLSIPITYGPVPPRSQKDEIDKGVVEDGYPKYMKKF